MYSVCLALQLCPIYSPSLVYMETYDQSNLYGTNFRDDYHHQEEQENVLDGYFHYELLLCWCWLQFGILYLILKAASWVGLSVCLWVRAWVTFFLNCYKTANNGWILEFNVSMEAA